MKVVIALGSNLGERESNLNGAIEELKKIIKVEKISKFMETDPVGGPEQPQFLNAVLVGVSELDAHELLKKTQEIEKLFGRERIIHWGPRTLDIDLISCGDIQIKSEELTLPHPLADKRKFVLEPWLEIDSTAYLVGKGSVSEILSQLNQKSNL